MNIYKTSGKYLAFTDQNNIFRWDGEYLGWLDNQNYIWSPTGSFLGQLFERNGFYYALRNTFQILPVSRSPRPKPTMPNIPTPVTPAPVFDPPIGTEDAF